MPTDGTHGGTGRVSAGAICLSNKSRDLEPKISARYFPLALLKISRLIESRR